MRRTNTSAKQKRQDRVIFIETLKVNRESFETKWIMFVNPTITLRSTSIKINDNEYEYRSIVRAAIDDKVEVFKEGFIWHYMNDLDLTELEKNLLMTELQIKPATFFMENLAVDTTNNVLGRDITAPDMTDLKKYCRELVMKKRRRDSKKSQK